MKEVNIPADARILRQAVIYAGFRASHAHDLPLADLQQFWLLCAREMPDVCRDALSWGRGLE